MTASVQLDRLDVIALLDISGSMNEEDTPSGQSRWNFAKEYVVGLVNELGEHDDDGIDLGVFNDRFSVSEGVKPSSISAIFKQYHPKCGTLGAPPLKWALDKAASRWSDKPQLILVITDGQPNDEAAIAQVIIEATKKMDRDEQCAISFLQVGNDAHATAYLQRLDDALQGEGAMYDIVDTGRLEDLVNMDLQSFVDKTFND